MSDEMNDKGSNWRKILADASMMNVEQENRRKADGSVVGSGSGEVESWSDCTRGGLHRRKEELK